MPAPASVILYDTRTWDGVEWDLSFHGPGEIENLGTGTTPDGGDFWTVVSGFGGTLNAQLLADGGNIEAAYDVTGLPWSGVGGMPQSATFTWVIHVGDFANASGQIQFQSSFALSALGGGIFVYVYSDPTFSQVATPGFDLSAGGTGAIEWEDAVAGIPTGTTIFVEFDFVDPDDAFITLWFDQTQIDQTTASGLGTTIDDAMPDINRVVQVLDTIDDAVIDAGDQWGPAGLAIVRGATDVPGGGDTLGTVGRQAWIDYFTGALDGALVVRTPDRYFAPVIKPKLGGLKW